MMMRQCQHGTAPLLHFPILKKIIYSTVMIHGKNDFHTHAVQSEIGKKSIIIKLWNNLPDDLKATTSLLSFKHRLKSYLLHTLEQ